MFIFRPLKRIRQFVDELRAYEPEKIVLKTRFLDIHYKRREKQLSTATEDSHVLDRVRNNYMEYLKGNHIYEKMRNHYLETLERLGQSGEILS